MFENKSLYVISLDIETDHPILAAMKCSSVILQLFTSMWNEQLKVTTVVTQTLPLQRNLRSTVGAIPGFETIKEA